MLDEIARTGEVQGIVLAEAGLVAVQHGVAKIVHIHGDAVAHDEHQDQAAEQRHHQTHRVTPQFQRLAQGIAEGARKIEAAVPHPRVRRYALRRGRNRRPGRGSGSASVIGRVRVLQISDKSFFQRFGAALFDNLPWRIAGQHPPVIHQRNAVAALGLVHEVGRDEDRHLVSARQIDEQLPEGIARHRIDARGRFVQDQQFRRMHQRHRQRQALAHAERQFVGHGIGRAVQPETGQKFAYPRRDRRFRHAEQARMQHQVLLDAEFGVQRKRLRHVADTPPRGDVARVHFLPEQPGFALARRQQAGEHLHGGGLAAAVGAEEAENLAAVDAEVDVVDRREIAEAHGQVARFDGNILAIGKRRHHDCPMAAFFFFRQQRDEGRLQRRSAGAFVQFLGRPGGENPPRVHRHQPVEAFGLLHVGGGDHHAHARTRFTDMGNQ